MHQTVGEVDHALQEQSTACKRITEFLEEMKRDTQRNEDSAKGMGVATAALREQANLLRQKVERFRI